MELDETTVNDLTAVPPIVVVNVLSKLLPVIVIIPPDFALPGLKLVIVGAGINLKPFKLADPPRVVTRNSPLEPFPTSATIIVVDTIVNDRTKVPPKLIE